MSHDPIKPRKHSRRRVALDASCRGADGRAHEVELTNLSEGGCQVLLRGGSIAPEQAVAVRPPTLEALPGVVRWSVGRVAGIEFAAPLYPAVVEHLSRNGVSAARRPGPPGQSGFTDNFGRTLPALGERRRTRRP